jgi:phage recombination protein Bet
MATATKEMTKQDDAPRHKPHEQLPSIAPPRLPYHPAIEQRFGVDKASWKALVEAIFPNATSTESVILALSYCRARKLDPFKRNVHIVPIWNKDLRRYVDTIWPGIGELRTTAFRTGEYAGRCATAYGPDVTQKVGSAEMTFPEWAQVTVARMVKGQRVEFCGPRVYWLETYANVKRDDDTPNDMWQNRPRGQLEKCAEAAALRAAFPEEVGGDYIPEEVQHAGARQVTVEGTAKEPRQLEALTDQLLGANGESAPDEPAANEADAGERPQTADEVDAALIEDLQAALAAAYEVGEAKVVTKAEEEYRSKATNEATRTAVSGLCDEMRAKLKASPSAKGKS